MRETEQEGDATRLTAQSQDTTRLTAQLEDLMSLAKQPENTTRLTVQTGVGTRISGLMAEDGIVLEGTVLKRTEKKSGKFPNNFDVTDKASDEVIEDANYDQVVWNAKDEEESSESPVEDRDKTMTRMWDAVTQPKEFGFAVGQDEYIKKVKKL